MAYTSPAGLRDKEYNSYVTVQTGSLSALAVMVASGTLAGTPVTISGTSIPKWSGVGSVLLCGVSGTTILALRCLNDGTLLISGA